MNKVYITRQRKSIPRLHVSRVNQLSDKVRQFHLQTKQKLDKFEKQALYISLCFAEREYREAVLKDGTDREREQAYQLVKFLTPADAVSYCANSFVQPKIEEISPGVFELVLLGGDRQLQQVQGFIDRACYFSGFKEEMLREIAQSDEYAFETDLSLCEI